MHSIPTEPLAALFLLLALTPFVDPDSTAVLHILLMLSGLFMAQNPLRYRQEHVFDIYVIFGGCFE